VEVLCPSTQGFCVVHALVPSAQGILERSRGCPIVARSLAKQTSLIL
jgi:hypothetical protein